MGADDLGLKAPRSGAHTAAIVIWVVLGVVRLEWLCAWIMARLRSHRTKIRVVGRKIAMQSDIHAARGRPHPPRISDRSGRPRFCKHQQTLFDRPACFDQGRPLGDRVYHCTYIDRKCQKDKQMRAIHLPAYDHFCNYIGLIVFLDTMKAYLLTLIFLSLEGVLVFFCSIAALFLIPHSWNYGVTMVLAAIIVLWVGSWNLWIKFLDLAMRNITIPEMGGLKIKAKEVRVFFWFRITIDSGESLDFKFSGKNPNPWDLGLRRNLHQVFGGWDCLLPWTQPPRVAEYGNPKHEFDFEVSDEFRKWVGEKREALRLRIAGSQPAVVPLDQQEEAFATLASGTSTATSYLSSPPTPLEPPPTPRLSPVWE